MFRVGLTRDFLRPDGSQAFADIDTTVLDEEGIAWACLGEGGAGEELPAAEIADLDAVLVLAPSVTAATLTGVEHLAVVVRLGVGYDSVDVDACTEHGIALTITPDGVRRPVASAALACVLALAHKMPLKDRLTRTGRWHEKAQHMGIGLRGRTLGLVGLGNIGCELSHLLGPHDMRVLAADPFADAAVAQSLGVELVNFDTLLGEADFVVVCCALTAQTRHLLSGDAFARMKPTAFLINVARGPIVDQVALTTALQQGHIAGAALDVFEQEPIADNDPLLELDNVILAPHALAWTDESFRMMGESAFGSILKVSRGLVPDHVVNTEVLETERFHQRLAACARRRQA